MLTKLALPRVFKNYKVFAVNKKKPQTSTDEQPVSVDFIEAIFCGRI